MDKEIIAVINTWKRLRRWQNTGDDGLGNTCGVAVFSEHEEAVLDLEEMWNRTKNLIFYKD